MRLTRRYWTIAGFGGALSISAIVLARPLLLVGTAGIGAWLLARQYLFVRALTRTLDDLSIDHDVARARTPTDERVPVSLALSLSFPSPLGLRIEARSPPAATGSTATDRTVWLPEGASEGETTFELSWPVAGSFRFSIPELTAIDPRGLFVQRVPHGPTPSIVVEPRGPREVHVGAGGERVTAAYGEHETGRHGSGLDPAELREYVPGDTARRIDWKTTARRGHPYVREYEIEADYTTLLLVDRRAAMTSGPAGETKLEYARHVALAFLDSAREFNDPLGLSVVGNDGVLDRQPPDLGARQYASIADRLRALRSDGEAGSESDDGSRTPGPAAVRRRASLLRADDSAFGSTLRPFFAQSDAYVERIAGDVLFETARTALAGTRGAVRTVIFTDDTHRTETRETVKIARRGDDRVLVFLTPSVLFEQGGLTDLESAYERYVDFERFRRELARLERVSAFEIGPGDRLDSVLAAGRERRQGHKQRA
jgi:uncharacterized protein (DUF58 family)